MASAGPGWSSRSRSRSSRDELSGCEISAAGSTFFFVATPRFPVLLGLLGAQQHMYAKIVSMSDTVPAAAKTQGGVPLPGLDPPDASTQGAAF